MAEVTIIPYRGKGEEMTREEARRRLSGILTEATESENSVCYVTGEDREPLEMAIKAMEEQRTGQWIEHFDESGKWYECNQCHTDWGGSVNYCPNCGTKMVEPQESEEEE